MRCDRSRPLRLVGLGLVLAACGSAAERQATPPATEPAPTVPATPPGTPATEPPQPDVSPGSQVAFPGEFDVSFRGGLSATLDRDDRGCWSLAANGEDVFVVLPPGFEVDGAAVVSPDGDVIPAGSPVDAGGALFSLRGLPGGAEGRLGTIAAQCRPGASSVAVTDRLVVDDFDPTELDGPALATLIEDAVFDVDWPCGFGFATSTADERVGLYVDPVVFEAPAADTVTLPDAGWRAVVVVGEHLFVNHCDDVAEWFEPDRAVAATFPLSAGAFEFAPPTPGSASDDPVTIVIDGAVVDGPTGPIPLGTITIDNDAYGFFAG